MVNVFAQDIRNLQDEVRRLKGRVDAVLSGVDLIPGSIPSAAVPAPVLGALIVGNATPAWIRLAISIPGSVTVRNALVADNGDTTASWKPTLDATAPTTIAAGDAAAAGTSLLFSHRDHAHAITSSSAPGAAASLLASDAGGHLQLVNENLTGWFRAGSAAAPANTTAGDLTAIRFSIGDSAFSAHEVFDVTAASFTPAGVTVNLINFQTTTTPDGTANSTVVGMQQTFFVRPSADSTTADSYGMSLGVNQDTGNFKLRNVIGIQANVAKNAAGSNALANMAAFRAAYLASAGAVTTAIGVDIIRGTAGDAGSIVTGIGLRIGASVAVTPTTDIAIQSLGGENRFVGNVQIGANSTPGAHLQINGAGVGTNAFVLEIVASPTAVGASPAKEVVNVSVNLLPTDGTGGDYRLLNFLLTTGNNNNVGQTQGILVDVRHRGTGTLTPTIGINVAIGPDAVSNTPGNMATITSYSTNIINTRSNPAATVTITTAVGYNVDTPAYGTAPITVTTIKGLNIVNLGGAGVTNAIAIDLAAQSGSVTLNFAIRNAGNSVQTGYARFGAVTAPTNVTAGDVSMLRLFVGADAAITTGFSVDFQAPSRYSKGPNQGYLATRPDLQVYMGSQPSSTTPVYHTLVLASSPVSFYHCDEPSGSLADSGSAAITLPAGTGTATYMQAPLIADDLTFALAANSGTGSFVAASVPTVATGSVTLECWVNIISASKRGLFFHVGTGSNGYGIGVGNTTSDNDGNNLVGIYSTVAHLNSTIAIGTGIHHVAMTISADGKTQKWYIDGDLVKTTTTASAPVAPSGGMTIGGETTAGRRWSDSGTLQCVAVYATELDGPTLRSHAAMGLMGRRARKTRTAIPFSLMPITGALTGLLLGTTTLAYVGAAHLNEELSLKQLEYNVSAAAVGAGQVVRVCIYSEDCQHKLVDVTDAIGVNTGVRKIAVSPSVRLPAGNYYLYIGSQTNAATTNATVSMQTNENTFNASTSEPTLAGNIAVTAGAGPVSFDPTAAITATANQCPYIRLTGDTVTVST